MHIRSIRKPPLPMGTSASKRVDAALRRSSDFSAACDSAYESSVELAQHVFPGLHPYQLRSAAARVHANARLPLLRRWAPSPPSQAQVDRAAVAFFKDGAQFVNRAEFVDFAVELFKDIILSKARGRVLRRVPAGVAGIAWLGAVTRFGTGVIGAVAGIYSIGVATSVYMSLRSDLKAN